MLKIGTVISDTIELGESCSVVWYSDDSTNERMDVISDVRAYNALDTGNCLASYIKGSDERYLGDSKIIDAIIGAKHKASMLHQAENKAVEVVDGKFVMTISKANEDVGVRYFTKMVNGKIESEIFEADGLTVEINAVTDTSYNKDDHPINWEEYVVGNTIVAEDKVKTVKVAQAEYIPYEELLRKYPQVAHVLDNDYVVVGSYEEAVQRLEEWANSTEQLKSYDIESYHTMWGPFSDNRITGVFLGYGTRWSTYFPFRQENFKYNLPIEFLRRIFDTINSQPPFPTVILLGHNMKFEIQGFYQEFRERIRFDIDTYLLAVLVDPLVKKGTHTLKALTAKVDGNFYLTLEQIFIGPVQFNVLDEKVVKLYGCPDATSPAKLFPYLMERLPKDEEFVKSLEMRLAYIKAIHNEFYGMRMDQEKLDSLIADEAYAVETLGNLFRKIHHTSKNINAYDTMSEILYYKLRCPVEVVTDKGLPATSKVAIDSILSAGKQDIDESVPLPKPILDRHGKVMIKGEDLAKNKYPSLIIYQAYKKATKKLGALNRLKNHSDHGFFKFYINQVGAGSNRQTSDAHQFDDTMKMCAVADSPYHRLVSCDWAQVELRILAGLAKELPLIELEKDPGVDIHRAICSIIKKTPMYLISEEDRKAAKPVNFGVVYMKSEYGLARDEHGPRYTKAQLADCKKRIMDFFLGLPCVKAFIKQNEIDLRKNGFIKTAFCYYRYFKELLDPTIDEKTARKMVRAGNNTPVQGTGAGMMKIVECDIDEYMLERGWLEERNYDGVMLPRARMILPIHDEILGSFDKDIPMEEIITMFKVCMELDIEGMPPFFATPAFVNNWYEGKNSVYEIPIEFRDKIVEDYANGIITFKDRPYLDYLQEYREAEIKNYMEGLISKYKTVDEVADHVRHDSLTHTLIETMIPDKGERKKLTHIERIHEATKRYMDRLESNGKLSELVSAGPDDEDEREVWEDNQTIDEWAITYARVDENGDLVQDDVQQEEVDYWNTDMDFEDDEHYADNIEMPRVMYLRSECLIDLTGLDMNTTAEFVNQEVQKLCNPKDYYNVVYLIGTKTIQTNFHIGYLADEISAIFDRAIEEVKV